VIEEMVLSDDQRDKIVLEYSEHNPLSPEDWDAIMMDLQLHHRLIALQADNLAASNGLTVPHILYYSFLSEFVQDDALVFMRATRSGSPGIYSGFSQSVTPFCEVGRNSSCTIPKSEAEAFRKDFQDSFRELQYVSTDGTSLSRVTTVLGSVVAGIVTTGDILVSRSMINTTTNPYLQDFSTMDDFWSFTNEQLEKWLDGCTVPLSWELTEFALQPVSLPPLPEKAASAVAARFAGSPWDYYVGLALDPKDSSGFAAFVLNLTGDISGLADNVSAYVISNFTNSSDSWYVYQAGCENPKHEHCRELYQSLESKLKEIGTGAKFSTFSSSLRIFPYRNVRTYAIMAEDCAADTTKTTLQKCSEIFETGNAVVACDDPPLPTNWVVVSISLVLIIAIIALWVVGCRQAKNYDKMQNGLTRHTDKRDSESGDSPDARDVRHEPLSED